MKLEESQKQLSQQDLGQRDEPPPPYDFDKDSSLAQDSDSDADAELDSAAKPVEPPPDWQTGYHNLGIVFLPNANAHSLADVDWEARLLVHAKDVPRLMKQGFYWTEANVRKREGYFEVEKERLPAAARDRGWSCVRVYRLADMAKDGDPQWIATLRVYAREVSVLSAFRVRHLSVNKAHHCSASDKEGRPIYNFHANDPGGSFNAVYDDRPLGGWWPWPKKSQGLEK
ncbi:Uncharacterized protein TPAR_03389 [Tolypocladium paradoxum]|uniref:Uncharacterized protein n=1 Tax=Tolypocladium paradoxum TaxID=94208 RepID=A0A2S4L1V7_9HYPO|nr:Uncharacterized protein TPAR_03389 [Tolypocladium paradoxum]